MKKHKLLLTDEQLSIVSRALEAYSRAHTAQFDIWFDETFNYGYNSKTVKDLDWEDRQNLNILMKSMILKKETGLNDPRNNGSFGIFSKDIDPTAFKAWDISKCIREFIAVQNNGGYWGSSRSFDGVWDSNNEESPEIEGFEKYIDFPLPEEIWEELYDKLVLKKTGEESVWDLVEPHISELQSHGGMEIVNIFRSPRDLKDAEKPFNYVLRIYKPVRKDV